MSVYSILIIGLPTQNEGSPYTGTVPPWMGASQDLSDGRNDYILCVLQGVPVKKNSGHGLRAIHSVDVRSLQNESRVEVEIVFIRTISSIFEKITG